MSSEEVEKIVLPPKARFKALVRMVLANVAWLGDIDEDEELTDNVARNIAIIRQKKKARRILTLTEKAILLKPAAKRTKEEKLSLRECIMGLKCFRRYPKHVRKKLSDVVYYLYYGPDRIIIKQGHPAEKMYFLVSGEISLTVTAYDEILRKTVTQELSVLRSGSAFGELTLLTNTTRSATCTTIGECELLAVTKEDFEKVLESTIRKSWGQVEEYMGKFCYFDTWDTFSRQRLCMAANVNDYRPLKIILGCGFGYPTNGYFVIKGKCLLISELKVVFRMGYKGPYAVRLYSKETGIAENEMIQSIFIRSCTFLPGGLFGFGVETEGRTIIAMTNVTCMTVPLDLLLQSKNTNYIWHRIIHYLEQNLPSKEVLFKCYLEQHNWLTYRSEVMQDALEGRLSPSTTSRSDVPYCCRLTDERRDM